MALVQGTNSYATLAAAELYFVDRLDAAAWQVAADLLKSQALIMATAMLDSLDWSGAVMNPTQYLAFPRDAEYFDPRLGLTVASPLTVPDRIIKATFEQAYHLLNNDDLLDNTGRVKNLSVGSMTLTTIVPASKMPMIVKKLIRPMLSNSRAANSWWRAN